MGFAKFSLIVWRAATARLRGRFVRGLARGEREEGMSGWLTPGIFVATVSRSDSTLSQRISREEH